MRSILLLLLAGLPMLVFVPSRGHAQVSCDPRWSGLRFQGTLTLTVTASGTNSFGQTVAVSNFETAFFQRNYLLGTTTFTNEISVVNQSVAMSCRPSAGNVAEMLNGGGALTGESSIDIVLDRSSCTYSLSLVDAVLVKHSIESCGQFLDLGVVPQSPSLGQLARNSRVQNLPLPPFGQPLKGEITDDSISYSSVPAKLTFAWNITALDLRITSVKTPDFVNDKRTFITTDEIALEATVSPALASLPVEWTVSLLQDKPKVSGFPTKQQRATGGNGVSGFTFTPRQNGALVAYRRSLAAQGSRSPNAPIAFEAVAVLDQGGISSALSMAGLGKLEQDETDTLRQEYLDIDVRVPGRAEVVPSLGDRYNGGNYQVQLSENLRDRFEAIQTSYRAATVTHDGQLVRMPVDARLVISSAYRNPQKNRAVGSITINSAHTRGRALDLVPLPVVAMVKGQSVVLSLHEALYPALASAVSAQGLRPLPEDGARPVPLGHKDEDHIHVEW